MLENVASTDAEGDFVKNLTRHKAKEISQYANVLLLRKAGYDRDEAAERKKVKRSAYKKRPCEPTHAFNTTQIRERGERWRRRKKCFAASRKYRAVEVTYEIPLPQ